MFSSYLISDINSYIVHILSVSCCHQLQEYLLSLPKLFTLDEYTRGRNMDKLNAYFYDKNIWNTPGTRGGPGGLDQTLALKRRKNARKSGSKAKDGDKEREKKKKKRYQNW